VFFTAEHTQGLALGANRLETIQRP
jgi:hypothetical protein